MVNTTYLPKDVYGAFDLEDKKTLKEYRIEYTWIEREKQSSTY